MPYLTKIVFAANEPLAQVDTFVDKIVSNIVNPLIGLIFAGALIYFMYGVVEFVLNRDKDEKRTEGKQHMIWGVVGMAIMVSAFGIINLLMSTVGAK